jgi:hypothetical protein
MKLQAEPHSKNVKVLRWRAVASHPALALASSWRRLPLLEGVAAYHLPEPRRCRGHKPDFGAPLPAILRIAGDQDPWRCCIDLTATTHLATRRIWRRSSKSPASGNGCSRGTPLSTQPYRR